jgi:hypothetical protein
LLLPRSGSDPGDHEDEGRCPDVTATRAGHIGAPWLVSTGMDFSGPDARMSERDWLAGALFGRRDDPIAVIAFTVTHGRIAAIDLIFDPGKLGAHLAAPCRPEPGPLTARSGRVEQQPGPGPGQPGLEAVRTPAEIT